MMLTPYINNPTPGRSCGLFRCYVRCGNTGQVEEQRTPKDRGSESSLGIMYPYSQTRPRASVTNHKSSVPPIQR